MWIDGCRTCRRMGVDSNLTDISLFPGQKHGHRVTTSLSSTLSSYLRFPLTCITIDNLSTYLTTKTNQQHTLEDALVHYIFCDLRDPRTRSLGHRRQGHQRPPDHGHGRVRSDVQVSSPRGSAPSPFLRCWALILLCDLFERQTATERTARQGRRPRSG
jgi:hypothetical protein